MRNGRWQYQQRADPLGEVNTHQLDKWEPRLSQPRPRLPFPTAVFVSACAFVPLPTETVTLDKWYRQPSEPVRKAAPFRLHDTVQNPQVLREGPITLDKWYRPASEPYLKKKPLNVGESFFYVKKPDAAGPEQYPDRWWQPTSQPIFRKPVALNYQAIVDPEILREGPITLDKWWMPIVQPYFPKAPLRQSTWYFSRIDPPAEGPITLDKWWQPTSTPRWGRKPIVLYDIANPQILREGPITLDKWWQPAPQILFRRPPLRISHWLFYVYTPPEVITMDKWWMPIVQPYFGRPPLRFSTWYMAIERKPTAPPVGGNRVPVYILGLY